jgi:glycogen debranching enzyme
MILLHVESIEPLSIVCGFLPVLQPMWPAGLGGQYAYWNDELNAYLISESTGKNHGIVGSPAASGISYTPAHMLSDTPNEFKIVISDPDKARERFIHIIIAGGKGQREGVLETYKKLKSDPEKFYRKNVEHYRALRDNTLRVTTPDTDVNLAFEWAKVAFDNLIVDNPDLGKGLVAGLGASGTSGRPGFGWFFGGDAYINCFSLLGYGAVQTARDTISFTQKWQREDGKMPHELSQAAGYIDWWKDYHFGFIHGDTTPYYIAAMYDYVMTTGDTNFIKSSWDSLRRAYEWCLSTDANRDGLMDNKKAGLGALEYGELTGIETDIYLAAVWTRSAYAMQYLAEIAGQREYSEKAAQHFLRAKKAFDIKFWDKDNGFYAHAFDQKGNKVQEFSPWNAVGLMWDFGTPERSLRSLERLCSSEIYTDWGIRSISRKSKYFEPMGYNYGAVWPFITGWVTAALYRHHNPLQAYGLLLTTAQHTFDTALGCISEVFSGTNNVSLQESVAHQGFSSTGFMLPFVRGLLGIEGNALDKTLGFSPQFPADWDHVSLQNLRVGEATFSIDFKRSKNRISAKVQAKNAGGYIFRFAPGLGIGSKIQSLFIDGIPSDFKIVERCQVVRPVAEIVLKENPLLIEMDFEPVAEILPPSVKTKTGERNRELKIISVKKEGNRLHVQVEGLSGKAYELGIKNPEWIIAVEGGSRQDNAMKFQMPEGRPGEFVPHQIVILLNNPRHSSD